MAVLAVVCRRPAVQPARPPAELGRLPVDLLHLRHPARPGASARPSPCRRPRSPCRPGGCATRRGGRSSTSASTRLRAGRRVRRRRSSPASAVRRRRPSDVDDVAVVAAAAAAAWFAVKYGTGHDRGPPALRRPLVAHVPATALALRAAVHRRAAAARARSCSPPRRPAPALVPLVLRRRCSRCYRMARLVRRARAAGPPRPAHRPAQPQGAAGRGDRRRRRPTPSGRAAARPTGTSRCCCSTSTGSARQRRARARRRRPAAGRGRRSGSTDGGPRRTTWSPGSAATSSPSSPPGSTAPADAARAGRADRPRRSPSRSRWTGCRSTSRGSIGIALHPEHGDDFATLLRHAEVAMYDAKHRGDAVAVYAPESDHNSPERLSLLGRPAPGAARPAPTADRRDHACTTSRRSPSRPARWSGSRRCCAGGTRGAGMVDPEELIRVAEQSAGDAAAHPPGARRRGGAAGQVARGRPAPAGRGQRQRPRPARPARSPTRSPTCCAGTASPRRPAPAGDHRGRADGRPAPGAGHHHPAGPARRGDRAGRLRHRLLVAAAPAPAAAGRGEDRPVVRARDGRPTPTTRRSCGRSSSWPARSGLRVVAEGVEDERTWRLLHAAGCHVGAGLVLRPADAGRRARHLAGPVPAGAPGRGPIPAAKSGESPSRGAASGEVEILLGTLADDDYVRRRSPTRSAPPRCAASDELIDDRGVRPSWSPPPSGRGRDLRGRCPRGLGHRRGR